MTDGSLSLIAGAFLISGLALPAPGQEPRAASGPTSRPLHHRWHEFAPVTTFVIAEPRPPMRPVEELLALAARRGGFDFALDAGGDEYRIWDGYVKFWVTWGLVDGQCWVRLRSATHSESLIQVSAWLRQALEDAAIPTRPGWVESVRTTSLYDDDGFRRALDALCSERRWKLEQRDVLQDAYELFFVDASGVDVGVLEVMLWGEVSCSLFGSAAASSEPVLRRLLELWQTLPVVVRRAESR